MVMCMQQNTYRRATNPQSLF